MSSSHRQRMANVKIVEIDEVKEKVWGNVNRNDKDKMYVHVKSEVVYCFFD